VFLVVPLIISETVTDGSLGELYAEKFRRLNLE
jgi:hypothetical protein